MRNVSTPMTVAHLNDNLIDSRYESAVILTGKGDF